MGSIEKFLRAWSALGGHVRIAAIPFERLGPRQTLQRSIVNDILAEAIGLKVPLQAIDGRIQVAVGTAKLALKRIVGREEELFAAAECVDILGPPRSMVEATLSA